MYKQSNEGQHTASLVNMKSALKYYITESSLSDVYIVADALDECLNDTDREQVYAYFCLALCSCFHLMFGVSLNIALAIVFHVLQNPLAGIPQSETQV
jgi:hypothetical protein